MSNETMQAETKQHGITIGCIRGNLYINDSGIRTDGEMTGISGVKECATCKWASNLGKNVVVKILVMMESTIGTRKKYTKNYITGGTAEQHTNRRK